VISAVGGGCSPARDEEMAMKTWLVTGAAAGLGLEIAREALRRGDMVAIAARAPEKARELLDRYPGQALPVTLDVTDAAAIAPAVQQVVDWAGSIDVLVNNAGRGIHGAVEEISDAEARDVFDLNVFSLLNVTRAVLPFMRARRSGHIVNVGSVAGLVGDAGTGLYSAGKFALEGISEAMYAELAPLGIKVTILEPGPFRTEFYGRSIQVAEIRIADYAETAGKRTAGLRAGHGKQAGDPAKAARLICDIVEHPAPPLHLCIGEAGMRRARAKVAQLVEEMARWEDKSVATAFPASD
jgi:NAD(P)-dependent dehydrogenase (short-subunit alcohol dehydrogenase family)